MTTQTIDARMTWLTREAACAGMPLELFYENVPLAQQYAKEACADCPLRTACLEHALIEHEQGVWGGTTAQERARMRRRLNLPQPRINRSETTTIRESIAQLLRRDRHSSAAHIAETIGVSERTVERVRAILQDAS